ncbi:hypothetical protein [Curtobacterium sp. B18]|uniref:hypothetical protein n=1 Tax=Curtobacterium sp. B18 TaxID=95614 RepID=UPI00034ACC3B|nr:hypothetical protein [Curtobacterium sp. B18]
MPTFRIRQGSDRLDVEAVTETEARARAVVSGRFRDDPSLTVTLFDGEHPSAAPDPVRATGAVAPRLDAAVHRPRPGIAALPSTRATGRTLSAPTQLLALVALVALLFAVVASGVAAITWHATRPGPLGECARIGLCRATPLSKVEQRTGVHFPDGTVRIRSSASRDGSYAAALVRLPVGSDVPALAGASSADVTARASAALHSASATDLRGRVAGHVGEYTGEVDGRTVVFVRYDTRLGPA